jgi:Domain of unknown function (DUF4394)
MVRRLIVIALLVFAAVPVGEAFAVTAFSVRSDVDDDLYTIDLATGTAVAVGDTGFADIEGLAFAGTTLYGIDDATDALVTINTATGAATLVGSLGVSILDAGLTFDCAGNLYMSTDVPGNLYRIDTATGAATLVGSQGQPVTGLTARGSTVFGLGGDATNNLVSVNVATGAVTAIGALGTVSVSDGGLDFDAAGTLWGLNDVGQIFTINPVTGAATAGAMTLTGFESLAIGPPICAPTAVTLRSVSAVRHKGSVSVIWRTASETALAGFHVYREQNGRRVRATSRIVAARSSSGSTYTFVDRSAPRGRTLHYWIQAINLDGSRTWHGPARAGGRA